MIIDKQQWDRSAGKWIYQRKKLDKLMYAHLILSIPLLIWIIRIPDGYEITWVGSLLLNGSFLFAVLVMISHFTLERQRKDLLNSHKMIEMLEEPKDQWGRTNEERTNADSTPNVRSSPDRVSARKS